MKMHVRWLLIGLCALLAATTSEAGGGKKTAPQPQQFGAPVTVRKPVNLAQLAKNPQRFAGKQVRIEGTVKEVCQGMGCWVEVESKGASFLARSLDESVLVPKDCKGRHVIVQGVVKALPKVAKEEPMTEGHACPRPEWVIATEGVLLK